MTTKTSFEKQFLQKQYLQTTFGIVETVDITPEKITDSVPVLLAPGWGETLELQKDCLKEVYLSGRRILALRHAIQIKKRKFEKYPIAVLQKAETILLLLEKKQLKKVDGISHSEGSINLAIAVTMKPQLSRSMVLVTPAGVSGKDSRLRIIIGFLIHVLKTRSQFSQLIKSRKVLPDMKTQKQETNITFFKRLLSFHQEITTMATFDIHPMLINLRKQGVKIAILAGEIDPAFPLKRMRKHLEKGITEYNVDTEQEKKYYGLDIFATKKGGHELYVNTHEIMQQVLLLLSQLNSK